MTVVVDAKIAVLWSIEAPLSELAVKVLRSGHALIAPDLIVPEVTNALYFALKDRDDRVERARDGLEFLPRWFTELVPCASLRSRAIAYALEFGHPAYDCFYLALATMRQVQMVTTDAHFIRKAHAFGHQASVVHLEDWRP